MILFGSSFLVYNLAAYASDPLAELRLSNDDSAQQQIAALTRQLNLDVPPPLRYFLWLRGLLGVFVGNLDLGTLVMVYLFNLNWPSQFQSPFV